MISFTKQTWVDLQSPYINASQLNRIETVLDALVNGSSRAVWRDGDTMTGSLKVATSMTIDSTGGNARLVMQKAGFQVLEKGLFSVDNTVREAVYDDAGAWIDDVISYARPAGGTVNIGGAGATRRDVNLTKDLKLAGTVRISSGGAGSLTTLATTGPATLAQATVSDLTTGRMVSTTTGGRLQALDAAGSRALIGAVAASEKGAANGVTPLGADSKIASTYLPSYVDDVLEFANLASFPATGESGKIYVAIDTAKTYRWSGSAYVVISETLALGEISSTAYRGDRGKAAFDHSQATGNPHGTTFAQIASTPTTLEGYGITDAQEALGYTPLNKHGDTLDGVGWLYSVSDNGGFSSQYYNPGQPGTDMQMILGGGEIKARQSASGGGAELVQGFVYDNDEYNFIYSGGVANVVFRGASLNVIGTGYGLKVNGNSVVRDRKTGWAAPTGTATRTTFATSTVTLQQLAERVKALLDDLISHGLIGA